MQIHSCAFSHSPKIPCIRVLVCVLWPLFLLRREWDTHQWVVSVKRFYRAGKVRSCSHVDYHWQDIGIPLCRWQQVVVSDRPDNSDISTMCTSAWVNSTGI